MSEQAAAVLDAALRLPAPERAAMIDRLISSLESPDLKADEAWAREAEDRVAAYEAGKLDAVSAEEVFSELDQERRSAS